MCGIFGTFGGSRDVNRLLSIINIDRGRDSFGFLTNKGMVKYLGSVVESLKGESFDGSPFEQPVFLGHTRNASVGAATLANAHPFCIGDVCGAHNGRVSNFWELKREFKEKDKIVDSFGVDSQIIFYLINKLGKEEALKRIDGKASIWWFDKREPNYVYLWCWQQVLAVAENPCVAFSSDIGHLRIAGFESPVEVTNSHLMRKDLTNPGGRFELFAKIDGYTAPKIAQSEHKYGYLGYNVDENTHVGEVWDVELKRWVKEKRLMAIESRSNSSEMSLFSHRVMLARCVSRESMFSCYSCHNIIAECDTELNEHKVRCHKLCRGISTSVDEKIYAKMRVVAASVIRSFCGVPNDEQITPEMRRAFISWNTEIRKTIKPRGVKPNIENNFSMCKYCTNNKCELHGRNALMTACLDFKPDKKDKYLCAKCVASCANKGTTLHVESCNRYEPTKNICVECARALCQGKKDGAVSMDACDAFIAPDGVVEVLD